MTALASMAVPPRVILASSRSVSWPRKPAAVSRSDQRADAARRCAPASQWALHLILHPYPSITHQIQKIREVTNVPFRIAGESFIQVWYTAHTGHSRRNLPGVEQ